MEMHAIQSKQTSMSSWLNRRPLVSRPLVSYIEVNTFWFGTGKRTSVSDLEWATFRLDEKATVTSQIPVRSGRASYSKTPFLQG
jgi:hypothetical protein